MLVIENDNTSGSGETASIIEGTACDLQEGSARRRAIDEWQRRFAEFQRDNPSPIVRAWREESRRIYRLQREAEGKTVRPYIRHNHVPWIRGETHESRERRLHRDRARNERGVDAQTVRGWTDLSSMSLEEKSLHKRKLANERKARSRKQPSRSPTDNATDVVEDVLSIGDIEWGMF